MVCSCCQLLLVLVLSLLPSPVCFLYSGHCVWKNWRISLRHGMKSFSNKDFNSFLQGHSSWQSPHSSFSTHMRPGWAVSSLVLLTPVVRPLWGLMTKPGGILPSTPTPTPIQQACAPALNSLAQQDGQGCSQALIHLFWNQQMPSGVFLRSAGSWPVILHWLSCLMPFICVLSKFSGCPRREGWFVLPSSPLLQVAALLIMFISLWLFSSDTPLPKFWWECLARPAY